MLQDFDPFDHSHPMRQAHAWRSRLRLFNSTKSHHLLSKLLADDSASLMLISLNIMQMNF